MLLWEFIWKIIFWIFFFLNKLSRQILRILTALFTSPPALVIIHSLGKFKSPVSICFKRYKAHTIWQTTVYRTNNSSFQRPWPRTRVTKHAAFQFSCCFITISLTVFVKRLQIAQKTQWPCGLMRASHRSNRSDASWSVNLWWPSTQTGDQRVLSSTDHGRRREHTGHPVW